MSANDDNIKELFKKLDVDTSLYPNIGNVVVSHNYNSNKSKRLLYDFLDIYDDNIRNKIDTTKPNLLSLTIDSVSYFVDFGSSGIFEQIPDNIKNNTGENIEEYIKKIQTLCNKVPIKLDVHGIFSGITNASTIQEKILCKMRLNNMILGKSNVLTGRLELPYYSFTIDKSDTTSRIVKWGTGLCKADNTKPNHVCATEFSFKITRFDSKITPPKDIYVVSVSSMIDSSSTLLPLPDYFIKNISSSGATNYLVSPGHSIGFSRNGTYNVKFVINKRQFNLVFEKTTNIGNYVRFEHASLNFDVNIIASKQNSSTSSNPFPDVTWNISSGSNYNSGYEFKAPTIVTDGADTTNIHNAIVGGNITNIDGVTIVERGVCLVESSDLANINKNEKISIDTIDKFITSLDNLKSNTDYTFKAYVKYNNHDGTQDIAYGKDNKFKTLKQMPSVKTNKPTSNTTMTGKVINPDGVDLVSYGIAFNDTQDDHGSKTSTPDTINTNHNGGFSVEITTLIPNKKYYVKAFVFYKDGAGTRIPSYGEWEEYTALSDDDNVKAEVIKKLTLYTTSSHDVTDTTASIDAKLKNPDFVDITKRGCYYDTIPIPINKDSKTKTSQSATDKNDNFECKLVGLSSGTKYHVRAYVNFSIPGSSDEYIKHSFNEVEFTTLTKAAAKAKAAA